MSAEENKAVVRRRIEGGWNRHNPDVIDEVVSPDYPDEAAFAEDQRAILSDVWCFYGGGGAAQGSRICTSTLAMPTSVRPMACAAARERSRPQ